MILSAWHLNNQDELGKQTLQMIQEKNFIDYNTYRSQFKLKLMQKIIA